MKDLTTAHSDGSGESSAAVAGSASPLLRLHSAAERSCHPSTLSPVNGTRIVAAVEPALVPATTTATTTAAATAARSWLRRVGEALTEERSFRAEERGERIVARELARLGHGWRVIHAIPQGPSNGEIDHLVIGPAGVFCLHTKQRRNSRREATRVATRLYACGAGRLEATGVLVPASNRSFRYGERPDVAVVQRAQLRRWLLAKPQVLDGMAVERIYEVAKRARTWKPSLAAQEAADAVARARRGKPVLRLVQG